MQDERILRNEAYNQYAATTKGDAQRRGSRFSTASLGVLQGNHFIRRRICGTYNLKEFLDGAAVPVDFFRRWPQFASFFARR